MPTLTITLSEGQKTFIDTEVKNRRLESISAYVAQLILMQQLKPHRSKIDALLLEGLQSGPATPMTEQDWKDIEREGLARLAEDKTNGRVRVHAPEYFHKE